MGVSIISEKLEDIRNYLDIEVHPVVSPDKWDVYAALCDMVDDTLVLLKAQEPHVLTLEEACGRDYCFYEYRATGYIEPASVVMSGLLLNDSEPLVEVYRLGRKNAALVAANGYGREWRCWDRMPEDGQKEAEPWN